MSVPKLLAIVTGCVLAAAAVAILVAVLIIPAERSFVNEVVIDAPPEKVWAVINDRERFPEWQAKVKSVDTVDAKTWLEHIEGSADPLRFAVAVDERPRRMEFHYTMGDSFSGHWRGETVAEGPGTRLTTTDSYKAEGSLTKVLIYAFFDMENFAKDWNAQLKSRVESLNGK
ncbi:MAG: SRPBCC family protein [Chloracidobacterium sp.]|nr:SRPBCC family protein [Chloracidobacterium sp.]